MRRTFPTLTGMTASGACAPSLREEHDTARPMREIGTRILRFTDFLFAFAVPVRGPFRSVFPGEHAPAERNRLGSVNAANVPNFDRDDGLRRLCALPDRKTVAPTD